MWSQVGLRKHHYEQIYWRWWNSSGAISNPERWCCESAALNMPANLENSSGATRLAKVSFHWIPKRGTAKECSNYCTIELILHVSKVMLKILQARLQQYMNCELPNIQDGFRKGRWITDQLGNIFWTTKKAREFQRNISVQFSSVTQLCPTLCDPMGCSMPDLSVPPHLLKFAQVQVHCTGDAI